MHNSCILNAKRFFDAYGAEIRSVGGTINVIEIGSQDVNGSIRPCSPIDFKYIGVDFVHGNGVDVVLNDPYKLPFDDSSVDVCLSNSCFEHSEFFWVLYLEIMRVLKPTGLFYLNAPSNGMFHRYPVDCWRFYPDSGHALVKWANRNGIDACLLESYISHQYSGQLDDMWNDFVAVFLKSKKFSPIFKNRIVDKIDNFENGWTSRSPTTIINHKQLMEDRRKISGIDL